MGKYNEKEEYCCRFPLHSLDRDPFAIQKDFLQHELFVMQVLVHFEAYDSGERKSTQKRHLNCPFGTFSDDALPYCV